MSQEKKVQRKETPGENTKPRKSRRNTRNLPYIIATVIIAAVVVLVGIAFYQQYVAPFQKVVMKIDNETVIKMRYFLDRAKLSGSGGLATMQSLNNEEILKLAGEKYGIYVTEEDIDKALRSNAAGGDNETISEIEFNEWYRQLLNERRVSGSLYRETVAATLREAMFREYINNQISTTREHAHVYAIFFGTYDEALAVKDRIDNGENFHNVARELSIDPTTREKGGEIDWIPQGVYFYNMDPFSLEVGKVSDVLAIVEDVTSEEGPSAYYVMMVTERDDREILDGYLSEVQSYDYQQWLVNESKLHTIKWNYNSEIDAWVSWQLSKSNPSTTAAGG
jgi:foldase protein PrsA